MAKEKITLSDRQKAMRDWAIRLLKVADPFMPIDEIAAIFKVDKSTISRALDSEVEPELPIINLINDTIKHGQRRE